ncbi:MAG: box helicase protein [Proteobacteria bacterium]|nr:box helicase protein [Pseudomonadota bacterium]
MSFSALGLADELVRAVTELGYTTPTPIQQQGIPAVLAGGDLMAGAQTGTGKTAGFVLPILQRLISVPIPEGRGKIRVLVLVPTRELAAQVEESVRDYGKHTRITSLAMFGGVSINPQIYAMRKRVDILVSTPGRLLDHVGQKTVDLSGVETLVLDEADRMLDMGFIRDIRKVLALLPKKRQNLLFSATFSDEIKELADGILTNPALIEVARRNATAELISQKVYTVDRDQKRQLLAHLIKENNWHQVLVFTRTKHGANRLAEQLDKEGITSMAIHGNKSQGARTRALSEFKSGTLQVLVATDIAARGIDISELPHVVNYELPNVPEDYVHRIGRTGRAGSEGEAISLVCVDELKLLADIERKIKREIPAETVPGFAWDPKAKPEPILNGRNGPRQGGGRPGQGNGGRSGQGGRQGQGQGRGSAKPQGQGQSRPAAKPAAAKPHGAKPVASAHAGNKAEPNGNVITPPREVNGNVAPPRQQRGSRNVPALLGGHRSGGRHH